MLAWAILIENLDLQPVYNFSHMFKSIESTLEDSREEKENILAYGTKDLLLVKCKQAIEELHVELEEEKKFRTQNEETIAKLEKENLEKDSKIRELQYKEEKFGGMNKLLK